MQGAFTGWSGNAGGRRGRNPGHPSNEDTAVRNTGHDRGEHSCQGAKSRCRGNPVWPSAAAQSPPRGRRNGRRLPPNNATFSSEKCDLREPFLPTVKGIRPKMTTSGGRKVPKKSALLVRLGSGWWPGLGPQPGPWGWPVLGQRFSKGECHGQFPLRFSHSSLGCPRFDPRLPPTLHDRPEVLVGNFDRK